MAGLHSYSKHQSYAASNIWQINQSYETIAKKSWLAKDAFKNFKTASARDTAIYFAAGQYLNQKITAYWDEDLENESYKTQRKFLKNYSKAEDSEIEPITTPIRLLNDDMILNAPAELLQLSREEWRNIIAVATNLMEPTSPDCKYPKRLTAIKDTLVKNDLLYGWKAKMAEQKSQPSNQPEKNR